MNFWELAFILGAIQVAHLAADFVHQEDWMAKGKSTSNFCLGAHLLAYTGVMMIALSALAYAFPTRIPVSNALNYIMVNAVAHLVTDWFTSRISSFYHREGRRHAFFVTIGVDQTIHGLTLLLTLPLLLNT